MNERVRGRSGETEGGGEGLRALGRDSEWWGETASGGEDREGGEEGRRDRGC